MEMIDCEEKYGKVSMVLSEPSKLKQSDCNKVQMSAHIPPINQRSKIWYNL